MGARLVEHRYHSIIIQQVAGAGFEGPLWSPENLKKTLQQQQQRTDGEYTEKPITEAPLIGVLMERWVERTNYPYPYYLSYI